MPIYNYECKECGHQFEIVLNFYDIHAVIQCPECGGEIKRIWDAPTVIFRGAGFYVNDSKMSKVIP